MKRRNSVVDAKGIALRPLGRLAATCVALAASFVACETNLHLGGDRSSDSPDAASNGASSDGAAAAGDSLDGGADPTFAQWPVPDDSPPVTNYSIANGTVVDQTTRLMWQQGISVGRVAWADAARVCADLRLGGYADWSVPSRIELVSIIDFTASTNSSVFNATVFPDDEPPCFWSSSKALSKTSKAWQIQAAHITSPADVSEVCAVRCVRGRGESPNARKEIELQGAIAIDHRTGLTWQQLPPSTLYEAPVADEYCQALDLGGLTGGWRLPMIKELQTIVDEHRSDPAVLLGFGDNVGERWASTGYPGYAWIVNFIDGSTISQPIDQPFRVRCVHP